MSEYEREVVRLLNRATRTLAVINCTVGGLLGLVLVEGLSR